MLKRIQAYLRKNPGHKAKAIAADLDAERREVNQVLYAHKDIFTQDTECKWSLVVQNELCIEFGDHRWLTASDFEQALLNVASPWDLGFQTITFVVAKDCRILLEALARLLALCNQLSDAGKRVCIDFSSCRPTLNYLNRIGFFDHLREAVDVLPRRPPSSTATVYDGNNDGVVEFRSIDPFSPNTDIPQLLRNSFVSCAGEEYSAGAFTFLSELFGNVQEHSQATVPGFAGLQFYKRGNRIQTVISDSGLGIVGTLAPILVEKYPDTAKRIRQASIDPRVALLQEVFADGGISQVNGDGRGLGLKRSGDLARKFRAKVSVRQENFELTVYHNAAVIQFSHKLNLTKIAGTHICFDLVLDQPYRAG